MPLADDTNVHTGMTPPKKDDTATFSDASHSLREVAGMRTRVPFVIGGSLCICAFVAAACKVAGKEERQLLRVNLENALALLQQLDGSDPPDEPPDDEPQSSTPRGLGEAGASFFNDAPKRAARRRRRCDLQRPC